MHHCRAIFVWAQVLAIWGGVRAPFPNSGSSLRFNYPPLVKKSEQFSPCGIEIRDTCLLSPIADRQTNQMRHFQFICCCCLSYQGQWNSLSCIVLSTEPDFVSFLTSFIQTKYRIVLLLGFALPSFYFKSRVPCPSPWGLHNIARYYSQRRTREFQLLREVLWNALLFLPFQWILKEHLERIIRHPLHSYEALSRALVISWVVMNSSSVVVREGNC